MPSSENTIKVRKNTGELVDFDEEKLREALSRSGATRDDINEVISQVKSRLYEGITTHKIYQIAYGILKKTSKRTAGRYRLKKAMLELGPTGYPFEHFVAKLLHFQGYEVQVGQIVQGRCVSHEIDVTAKKPGRQLMVECKYHSDKSAKSDVKVPLYIHSRFLDVVDSWKKIQQNQKISFEGMVVTNSRFTEDAFQYGTCAGLSMVSWDQPEGDSLKDWIDRAGFHPVTVLQSLKKDEKQELLTRKIVLCRDLAENPQILQEIVYPSKRAQAVLQEVKSLLE
jgi:Holliday junction resolvase-like predicted endonuclease